MQKNTRAFNENLSILLDELNLAEKWEQASIIYTIHNDIFSQLKTKKFLSKKLRSLDHTIVEIQINKVEKNLIEHLVSHQKNKKTVFYLSNVDWGGGKDNKDCYRALNLHRETFIEQRIKVVFFLTANEASKLPYYAPDFWAFRHLVLRFASTSPRNKRKPPVGILLWQLNPGITLFNHQESNISNLRKNINGIPKHSEAIALRLDMQYELANLTWFRGDIFGAEKILKNELNFARSLNFSETHTKLVNGLAIVNYERENYQEAIRLLEPLVNENPRDCLLLLNHAISLFALNKRYLARRKGINASNLCNQNPWIKSSLGFLYYFAGKMDEAITCFQNAIKISPKNAYWYEALVVCYLGMGLQDKANEQLSQAKIYSSESRFLHNDVLMACIEEKREKALNLIRNAISVRKLAKLDINRDPILYALFDYEEV
jgi:Flp pilus assembly protein TadD